MTGGKGVVCGTRKGRSEGKMKGHRRGTILSRSWLAKLTITNYMHTTAINLRRQLEATYTL